MYPAASAATMARTWGIWSGTARSARCRPSAVRSTSLTPASSPTAASTSGGMPRSSTNSGLPPAWARAARTGPAATTGAGAPVAVTSRSATASAAGTSLACRCLARSAAVTSAARAALRLATDSRATPASCRSRAASLPVVPVPRTTAWRSAVPPRCAAVPPRCAAATSRPARASEMPSVLIAVCVRARLLAPQRRVDQPGHDRAGGSRRGGRAGRGLELGDNLVLTDSHRIQPAGDTEQVLGGRTADPGAGHPQDLAGPEPPPRGHQARDRPGHLFGRP